MKTMYKETRMNTLMNMSTEELAIAIGEYFDTHATMPGQKDLKLAAERIVANKAENQDFEIDEETKKQMASKFTDIVVREMKVTDLLVRNVNKETKEDASVMKPTDLNLTEAKSIPGEGKSPAKMIFTAPAKVVGGDVYVNGFGIGSLGNGFKKNNPDAEFAATLVATDYSNGKFANVSYTIVADIAA